MGRRELVIIAAFVAAGLVAYQLTAPAPRPGETPFSLSSVFSRIRQQARGNAATAATTRAGTLPVGADVNELRLSGTRGLSIVVTGEPRADIGYELGVESSGPDEATARDWAGRVEVTTDDLGTAQAVAVRFPRQGTQTATLALRVPRRLLVRVESASQLTATGVRAVDLRNLAGEVGLSDISGAVTGSHRASALTVTRAGSVNLWLVSSHARLSEIGGRIALNARNGDCDVAGARGELAAVVSNVDLTVTGHHGPVTVSGEGGTLRVAQPWGPVAVDAARMLVEVALATAVDATLVTTDEPLRLTLDARLPLTVDALAVDGGTIRAADLGVTPVVEERRARLSAARGRGGPRLVVRNTRADIVIGLTR